MIALGAVALLSLTASCVPDVDDLESEVSRVCVRGVAMPFPGSSGGTTTSRLDIAALDLDLDKLEPGATMALESLEMAPGVGVEDLAFADRIAMGLISRNSGTTELVAVESVGTANPVHADGDPDLDILPILRDAQAQLEMTVSGEVPGNPWAAAVDVCLAVQE